MPFLVLAVWSRVWLGFYCIVPITNLVVWVFVNPRFFNKPASFDSWGSKAVLGERVYINDRSTMPLQHKQPILILNVLQTIAGLILVYGVWRLNLPHTLYGMALVYMTKMWFLDRMVWLYEDTKNRDL